MTKDEIRQKVWDYLEKNNLVTFPKPGCGRIPNFIGAKIAAAKIQELKEKGLLNPNCKVVTVVHDCQIVDDFPEVIDEHDVKVDYIITPTQIIATK
jgi:5-formyltetrahydrofolate cyclo-ligase